MERFIFFVFFKGMAFKKIYFLDQFSVNKKVNSLLVIRLRKIRQITVSKLTVFYGKNLSFFPKTKRVKRATCSMHAVCYVKKGKKGNM